ncbi:MAG: SET domain-containing protein-lysine N-methyltransferase [Candidatus Paceibacterota bacterium]
MKELYSPAKYELRPSKIIPGEVGLFSLRNFKKGEVVIDSSSWDEGKLMTWQEFENIDSGTKRQLIFFCYKTEEGVYVPKDINKINIGYFSNHSCDPNLIPNEKDDYVANKNISAGEELTIDVQALMKKPIFEFDCKCGSSVCRKKVKI